MVKYMCKYHVWQKYSGCNFTLLKVSVRSETSRSMFFTVAHENYGWKYHWEDTNEPLLAKLGSKSLTGKPERSAYFLAGLNDGGASMLLSAKMKGKWPNLHHHFFPYLVNFRYHYEMFFTVFTCVWVDPMYKSTLILEPKNISLISG